MMLESAFLLTWLIWAFLGLLSAGVCAGPLFGCVSLLFCAGVQRPAR